MKRVGFVNSALFAPLAGALLAAGSSPGGETEFDLAMPTGTLFGTLTLPSSGGRVPVVLIIAGSGPTDRDGNSPQLRLDCYKKLAAALAAAGIASVRYDKRGIAASHAAMTSEADLRFDTLVQDAVAWVAKLRGDARFSRVTIAGHSEGSLIGMLAAQHGAVDAFVSIAGAGAPAGKVLRIQLQASLPPQSDLAVQAQAILTDLESGKTVPADKVPEPLLPLFRPSVQPYLLSWFKYDPRVEIAKLPGREVTIVQGTHDIQVPVDEAKALATACVGSKLVLIDGMTHVLVDDPGTTLAQQLAGAYADAARPLDATLVATVTAAANS